MKIVAIILRNASKSIGQINIYTVVKFTTLQKVQKSSNTIFFINLSQTPFVFCYHSFLFLLNYVSIIFQICYIYAILIQIINIEMHL